MTENNVDHSPGVRTALNIPQSDLLRQLGRGKGSGESSEGHKHLRNRKEEEEDSSEIDIRHERWEEIKEGEVWCQGKRGFEETEWMPCQIIQKSSED